MENFNVLMIALLSAKRVFQLPVHRRRQDGTKEMKETRPYRKQSLVLAAFLIMVLNLPISSLAFDGPNSVLSINITHEVILRELEAEARRLQSLGRKLKTRHREARNNNTRKELEIRIKEVRDKFQTVKTQYQVAKTSLYNDSEILLYGDATNNFNLRDAVVWMTNKDRVFTHIGRTWHVWIDNGKWKSSRKPPRTAARHDPDNQQIKPGKKKTRKPPDGSLPPCDCVDSKGRGYASLMGTGICQSDPVPSDYNCR